MDFETLYQLYVYYSEPRHTTDDAIPGAEMLASHCLTEICKMYDIPLDKSGRA